MLLSNFKMVFPGNRSIISPGNFTTSPRSPLDMRFSLPGSSKRYDDGGIGLGIVAALDKSGIRINRQDISSKQIPVNYSDSGSIRTNPVQCTRRFQFPKEIDLSEEYTCVTRRDGMTKVYYNNDKFEFCDNRSDGERHERRLNKSTEAADEIPAKKREALRDSPDFLRFCCLCKKKLQGKDIYMYKGDKGFCSKECRSVRIMEDNINVQHKSKSVEVLSSPYAGGRISSAGIFVI